MADAVDKFLGIEDEEAAPAAQPTPAPVADEPEDQTLPPISTGPALDAKGVPTQQPPLPSELPVVGDDEDFGDVDAFLNGPDMDSEEPVPTEMLPEETFDDPIDSYLNSPITAQDQSFRALTPDEIGELPDISIPASSPVFDTFRAARRGWANAGLAFELDRPTPNANAVFGYQQRLQQLAPSPSYSITMDDNRPPIESWNAFKNNPVGVFGELIAESFAGFTRQMISKGPAPLAIWTAAGALLGGPKGALLGVRAGYANAAGLASYSLEMSQGILESLEQAGVDMSSPEAMQAAFDDKERMDLAREFAEKKAVPVAAFDVASALIAGRLVGRKGQAVIGRLGAGAVEMGVQAFLGAAGEAAGQLNQKGEIESWRSVGAEAAAEFATGTVDVVVGSRINRASQDQTYGTPNMMEGQATDIAGRPVSVEATAPTMSIPATRPPAAQPPTPPAPPAPVVPPSPEPGPGQGQRQFEETAKGLPNVPEETKGMLGSVYDISRFKDSAEAAKAWINDFGLEAAMRLMSEIGLTDGRRGMTPVEIAIAVDLAGRLGGMGDYAGQAFVLKVVSKKGTSMGAAIAHLKIIRNMTPEGVVMYAQGLLEDYITTLPPERQENIRAAQAEIDRIAQTVREVRQSIANDLLLKGKYNGQNIQKRIQSRLADKSQLESTLVEIRAALTGPSVKEATQSRVGQILANAGMSKSEADAMAASITKQFYGSVDQVRKNLIIERRPSTKKALQEFNQLVKDLDSGNLTDEQYLSQLSHIFGVPAMTPELAAKLRQFRADIDLATDEETKTVLSGQMYETAMEVVPQDVLAQIRSVAYLAMLFAPKTWMRNILGNTFQFVASVGRDFVVSYGSDPFLGTFVTGKRRSVGLQLGERFRGLLAPAEDFMRGWKWASEKNSAASGTDKFMAGLRHLRVMSKLTTQNKWEINDVKDINRRMFSSKHMQMLESTLSVALGAFDRAFWMSQYRTSLAQMEAAAKKNGEWTGAPTSEMIEAAQAEAMYAIYQNPNFTSKQMGKLRDWLNFGKPFGIGTGVLPFAQVPGALTQRGLVDVSPVGFIQAMYRGMRGILYANGATQTGRFDQAAFNKEFAQALVGTGLWGMGLYLYRLGIITASREEDDDVEAFRRASGLGAYQINLTNIRRRLLTGDWTTPQKPVDGDTLMDYGWAQPLAIVVAGGAEYGQQRDVEDRAMLKSRRPVERADALAISMLAGAKSLQEEPLLKGLVPFFKIWGQKEEPVSAAYQTVLGMPGMFVPQLVRQANQYGIRVPGTDLELIPGDNIVREVKAPGAKGMAADAKRVFMEIVSQLPGMSEQFPPRFDIMGEAVERYGYDGNTFFNVFINPTRFTKFREDPALQEVGRLMNETGETRHMPRQFQGQEITINGESIQLTNEQIAAYRYYTGNLTISTMYRRMASPAYAKLPDQYKVDLLAADLRDVHASVKSALFGHSVRNLTSRQRALRVRFLRGIGAEMPPMMEQQSFVPENKPEYLKPRRRLRR